MSRWRTKLAAWLHDPAEKALILMRDTAGHEGGSIVGIGKVLGFDTRMASRALSDGTTYRYEKLKFDPATDELIHRADCLAAGADRPDWPQPEGEKRLEWANVRFTSNGVLRHPLSGETIDLRRDGGLSEQSVAALREVSFAHFTKLIERDGQGAIDERLTFYAFWRFGSEPRLRDDGLEERDRLGELWRVLPADTRTPDHTIWSHLDTVSALAGAMDGGDPALLVMSFGPVQPFIAQSRSTSDLWAGSHLLSTLVWEGLRVICDELGPDAVMFPHLRGVAAVDKWLMETAEAAGAGATWRRRFEDIGVEWLRSTTDANPLFAATLPNKFMAIVPAGRSQALAEQVITAARGKALEWALQAAELVFEKARHATARDAHWRAQVVEQMRNFPEVHWARVAWTQDVDSEGFPDTTALERALAKTYPIGSGAPGVFADPLWKLLSEGEVAERQGRRRQYRKLVIEDGHEFFVPNHGLLYPAVQELAERGLAATKTLRAFEPLTQRGHRCTLTGESEWLTENPEQLALSRTERGDVSAWGAAAGAFGIKEGEHLGARATLKRLWPTLFVKQVESLIEERPDRFTISTHTMALASSMAKLAALGERIVPLRDEFIEDRDRPVALPASLHMSLLREDGSTRDTVRRLPAALDRLRESERAGDQARLVKLESRIKGVLGHTPEAYYALIKMDGDRMGAWMAANEGKYRLRYCETWHPTVVQAVRDRFGNVPAIAAFIDSHRPASPARHAALSGVLNDFSAHVAHHVIERVFKGKLIYAGGDDVLAMVSVDDLPSTMLLLRAAYSGLGEVPGLEGSDLKGLELGRGYVRLSGRLHLMMGPRATASTGAVIAHHQAPLGMVLRQLREAESRAKGAGRDRFCIRVLKRGGGEVTVTSPWWAVADGQPQVARSALTLMNRLRDELAFTDFSRAAIYRAQLWFEGLPDEASDATDERWRAQMAGSMARQFARQRGRPEVAREIVDFVCDVVKPRQPKTEIGNFLAVAEFCARESRIGRNDGR